MKDVIDSFLELNTAVVAVTGVTIYGVFKHMFKTFVKKQNEHDELLENLKHANLATLHNEVYQIGKRYIEREKITVEELDNFSYLFQAYKALGGNGTGDAINDRVNSLPIISGTFYEFEQASHFVAKDAQGNFIRTDGK